MLGKDVRSLLLAAGSYFLRPPDEGASAIRPDDLVYAVGERPPLPRLLALGSQHAVLASLYLILIVIVARKAGAGGATMISMMSLALIALAFASALQASRAGSGYLAVPVYSAIYLGPSVLAAQTGGLPLVFGMTIFAGLVEISLSLALRRLRWLFPPAVSGLIVVVVGIDLGLVGLEHALGVSVAARSAGSVSPHVIAAFVTLAAAIAITIWGRGIFRLLATLIGLAAGTATAVGLGLISPHAVATVRDSAWIAAPSFAHLSFAFDPALVPPFLAAAIAATLRTIGVVTTCEKINDAGWKRPVMPPIRRGALADGLGCVVAGLLGAPGLNTAPSLVGVSNAARATSRWIAFASAGILLAAAFVPKFGTLFLALPLSVAGGMLVFTGSLMIAGGIGIMVSRALDVRATFTIGISILLALSHQVYPSYFRSLPQELRTFTGGSLSLCVLSAIVLTILFRLGARRSASVEGGSFGSIERFIADIPERCRAWKVPADIARVCRDSVEEAVEGLKAASGVERFESCRLSYNDMDLVVELRYVGPVVRLPGGSAHYRHLDEEQAFAHGISLFLTGIHPDRVETRSAGDHSIVRFIFVA